MRVKVGEVKITKEVVTIFERFGSACPGCVLVCGGDGG